MATRQYIPTLYRPYRTEQARRPGEPRVHPDVLQQRLSALAGLEGGHEETEVRAHQREKDADRDR